VSESLESVILHLWISREELTCKPPHVRFGQASCSPYWQGACQVAQRVPVSGCISWLEGDAV
jgi:hypothetical protein